MDSRLKQLIQRAFRPYVKHGLKIAIEAGNQTAWIYDCLVETGTEVIVVNPNKVKLIAESRRKTDKIDARILCELLRGNLLPRPVHMPSPEARSLRTLLNARRQLIRNRTRLCNTVRGVLRQEGVRLKARGLNSKKAWQELRSVQYKGAHIPTILRAYYPAFEALTQSLRELDKELKLKAEQDPRVELLKTMPMVGVIAALTLIAAIDDEARFTSSRQLVSYSGLAPIVRQSGERATYGPISREGRRELRAIWVQIAHLVATDDSGAARPLRSWFLRLTVSYCSASSSAVGWGDFRNRDSSTLCLPRSPEAFTDKVRVRDVSRFLCFADALTITALGERPEASLAGAAYSPFILPDKSAMAQPSDRPTSM